MKKLIAEIKYMPIGIKLSILFLLFTYIGLWFIVVPVAIIITFLVFVGVCTLTIAKVVAYFLE